MRATLKAVLVVLILVELYLASAFLPTHWQVAIDHTLLHLLPQEHDQTAITHPALEYEIDQALQKLPLLRFSLYAFFALLLTLNAFLINRIWKALRHKPRVQRSLL